jgi:hypothetical protein
MQSLQSSAGPARAVQRAGVSVRKLRALGAAAITGIALAASLPAAAVVLPMDGTIFISGRGPGGVGRCAPAGTISNIDVTATHSNYGTFVFNASECIGSPPPAEVAPEI